ncbi:MAG: cytochrome P450 [Proteobacteria bacterium]|nr:cytochrome P450 [Pseudomonadota bacterium]
MDLLSPGNFRRGQPHAQFAWLREHAPVYRHPEPDGPGFWALTRHEEVRAVGRDSGLFSSERGMTISDSPAGSGGETGGAKMMLVMDPPEHTQFLRLLSREFTPRAARALAPRIRALAAQIVDEVIERGECDFVAEIAGELPSYVIAELVGMPLDDGRKLYELTETLHTSPESQPPGAQARATGEMFAYASRLIEAKRRRPGGDLATQLLQAEIDGRRLTDVEFQLFFMLLIDAGGDTTRNLVAGGMLALLEHPEQQARLRADIERRLPTAREELLRWTSPVVYMRRTATADTELAGVPIAAGDKLVMYYGSANRDPRAFPDAGSFDVGRSPNHHVAFGGGGAHFCLGAHVARIEIDAMLREVLLRLDGLELTEEPEWLESNFISGPRRMPVRFRPGRWVSERRSA